MTRYDVARDEAAEDVRYEAQRLGLAPSVVERLTQAAAGESRGSAHAAGFAEGLVAGLREAAGMLAALPTAADCYITDTRKALLEAARKVATGDVGAATVADRELTCPHCGDVGLWQVADDASDADTFECGACGEWFALGEVGGG